MNCGTGRTSRTSRTGATSGTERELGILNWAQAASLRQRGEFKKGYEKARKNDPDNKSCKNK